MAWNELCTLCLKKFGREVKSIWRCYVYAMNYLVFAGIQTNNFGQESGNSNCTIVTKH